MKARTSGKSRLFIGFTAILLLFVFVLFLSSSQQQVDELRVAGIKCEQHEMALKAQYDAQMEKVALLERSGEEMHQKLRAEKDLRDKAVKDANMRFASLQQHYRTLQKEHEDGKTEQEDSKRDYEERIKSLMEDKVAEVDEWKNKFKELEKQFKRLEEGEQGGGDAAALKSKNQQLTEELYEMRNHCAFRVVDKSSSTPPVVSKANEVLLQRSFGEQILISGNTYQIPMHIDTPVAASSLSTNNNSLLLLLSANRSMDLRRDMSFSSTEVSHLNNPQVTSPQSKGVIINSVENFQILPHPIEGNENVLKEPQVQASKSSTATLNKKKDAKGKEQALPIAVIQKQSPPLKPATEASVPKARKLPNGVVPIPESMNILLNNEEAPQDVKNSRYSNVAESPLGPIPLESGEHKDAHFLVNGNEVENGAHEVNDFNIVEDRNNHHDNPEDEDKIVINNNAAEVHELHAGEDEGGNDKEKRNELDLAIINRDVHVKDGGQKKGVGGNEDFVADQGFEDHMEEHVEEEDDDEYPNLAAQQEEGPAVRN